MISNFLNDSAFLKEIDKMRIKEQYVKITVLNFQEQPIQEIQGKILSGNLNLDGRSSIRRTCNLTMIADAISNNLTSIDKTVISINKKIRLEVGFLNTTYRYRENDILEIINLDCTFRDITKDKANYISNFIEFISHDNILIKKNLCIISYTKDELTIQGYIHSMEFV